MLPMVLAEPWQLLLPQNSRVRIHLLCRSSPRGGEMNRLHETTTGKCTFPQSSLDVNMDKT